jgi:hypothetical protein
MTRAALPILVLLGLAACQAAPPAPYRPISRAPARVAPPPAPVDGDWSFSILADRCTARVAHRDMALAITAGPAKRASFALTAPNRGLPPSRAIPMSFRGDAGRWQLSGRSDARRTVMASLPLDATGTARIQDLLGGGTLTASGRGVSAPALVVPDAGVAGRDWYGCVAKLGDAG